jgi:hypothetical protein
MRTYIERNLSLSTLRVGDGLRRGDAGCCAQDRSDDRKKAG